MIQTYSILSFAILHSNGYLGCFKVEDWFYYLRWFFMTCTIYCISIMSLLVYLDIICMHSCKYIEIKWHIASIYIFSYFSLFCLLIQVVSCEETHAYYCILRIHHILCLIVHGLLMIKIPWGVDVLPLFFIFLSPVSVPSLTLFLWHV